MEMFDLFQTRFPKKTPKMLSMCCPITLEAHFMEIHDVQYSIKPLHIQYDDVGHLSVLGD